MIIVYLTVPNTDIITNNNDNNINNIIEFIIEITLT